ncbi:iron uptake system protein EfeO [Actinomadura sp. HBU206391]|uniref:iron uptake system protein EfeO n=1 Tax=Actinomadura sp. HBU206391 TaxID=2731692 RepID=UPI00164FAA72|nr:iron uptake system protein EfeO [Actinomadura sp. HBU206391]MBC6461282.1 iron uptake system protein EfeO [Actinomadura sp. HBU206391]
MRAAPILALVGAAAVSMSLLTACGGDDASDGGTGGKGSAEAITVDATDTVCDVAKKELAAGTTTFKVTNRGSKVTEVYIYAPGDKIVTERENIGPGTSVELTTQLNAGKYQLACKPGMVGDGIRQDLTVTGQADHATDPRLTSALAAYKVYVNGQVDDTIAKTDKFVAAVKKGDIAEAKRLYAPSRVGWESIEPVAESFGDLDPRVDLREADLEKGQKWTGWHRLEKALWKTKSVKGEGQYADQLVKDLAELKAKVSAETLDPPITPASMANGAKELLDEVATGKITGEEEIFSHTDLVDFAANLDGARKVHELLLPVVREKDAALATTLDQEFQNVTDLLAKYKEGDGYVSYDTVDKAERKKLSTAVDALAEPLSKLAGVVSK